MTERRNRTQSFLDGWTALRGDSALTAAGPAPADPAAGPTPPGDSGGDETPTPDPTDGTPTPGTPTDIDNDAVCENTRSDGEPCAHPGSAHADTADGLNTGACSMQNCDCSAMQPPVADESQIGDGTGGEDDSPPGSIGGRGDGTPSAGGLSAQLAEGDPPVPVPEAAPAGAPAPAPDASTDDGSSAASDPSQGADGGDVPPPSASVQGPAFTIPVGVVEGIPTSDGRMIQPQALTSRIAPLPLMWLNETSPYGHEGAFLAGRIDVIERDPANPTSWRASGNFLATEQGLSAADELDQMGAFGVSADIGDVASEIVVSDPSGNEIGALDIGVGEVLETLTRGEIMGFTGCPMPAFPGCYIVLGDGSGEVPAIAQQTPDQSASVESIHVLSTTECEPCRSGENSGEPLVASGAPESPPAAWFSTPEAEELIPLTVDADGRVYGHLAPWNACHIGLAGCVVAPHSATGYAYFHTGAVVTAEGTEIAVGNLTVGTGHAPQTGAGATAAAAAAHYDHTGTAVADVRAVDGVHGIWLSGALRPWATPDQIRTLRAAPPSGDWRRIAGRMELVAALGVNTPGFPVPRPTAVTASGRVESLVAAGAPEMVALAAVVEEESTEDRLSRLERVFSSLGPVARDGLRSRYAAARGR